MLRQTKYRKCSNLEIAKSLRLIVVQSCTYQPNPFRYTKHELSAWCLALKQQHINHSRKSDYWEYLNTCNMARSKKKNIQTNMVRVCTCLYSPTANLLAVWPLALTRTSSKFAKKQSFALDYCWHMRVGVWRILWTVSVVLNLEFVTASRATEY